MIAPLEHSRPETDRVRGGASQAPRGQAAAHDAALAQHGNLLTKLVDKFPVGSIVLAASAGAIAGWVVKRALRR